MLVVIPYKDDGHDGHELRYALRSMVKHFRDMTGCVLVGDKPSWYTGDHIAYPDIPKRKEYSIYRKLMCVRGRVLYSNDDYFALQDFDEGLPNYFNNICGSVRPPNRQYRMLYAACPPEWFNFDIHTPMVIDTLSFDWDEKDRPIKTQYANTRMLEGTQLDDMKITGPMAFSDMQMLTEGRPFFSLNGNATYPPIQQFLKFMYPEPSKYERH